MNKQSILALFSALIIQTQMSIGYGPSSYSQFEENLTLLSVLNIPIFKDRLPREYIVEGFKSSVPKNIRCVKRQEKGIKNFNFKGPSFENLQIFNAKCP